RDERKEKEDRSREGKQPNQLIQPPVASRSCDQLKWLHQDAKELPPPSRFPQQSGKPTGAPIAVLSPDDSKAAKRNQTPEHFHYPRTPAPSMHKMPWGTGLGNLPSSVVSRNLLDPRTAQSGIQLTQFPRHSLSFSGNGCYKGRLHLQCYIRG